MDWKQLETGDALRMVWRWRWRWRGRRLRRFRRWWKRLGGRWRVMVVHDVNKVKGDVGSGSKRRALTREDQEHRHQLVESAPDGRTQSGRC